MSLSMKSPDNGGQELMSSSTTSLDKRRPELMS